MTSHSFDIALAEEYKSVELAILISHLQHWIIRNKRLKLNEVEGKTWIYQTLQEISALFPYWSVDQVKRLMDKAVKLNILVRKNFNRTSFDRTCGYAFSDEEKFLTFKESNQYELFLISEKKDA